MSYPTPEVTMVHLNYLLGHGIITEDTFQALHHRGSYLYQHMRYLAGTRHYSGLNSNNMKLAITIQSLYDFADERYGFTADQEPQL